MCEVTYHNGGSSVICTVTDHEIMKGIVEAKQPELHTLFFKREMAGLSGTALLDDKAANFVDLSQFEEKVCMCQCTRIAGIHFETKLSNLFTFSACARSKQ